MGEGGWKSSTFGAADKLVDKLVGAVDIDVVFEEEPRHEWLLLLRG